MNQEVPKSGEVSNANKICYQFLFSLMKSCEFESPTILKSVIEIEIMVSLNSEIKVGVYF